MTALNFPDSPSNGDTYQGYTYNSTKSTWAKPEAAATAVYANTAALPTSGTAGDMAYVTATNRLYLWTGTGWYNIALINNNPTISGVNSSYALATDGTATTVTITATDPEGLPITYSLVSDTSGNTATVVQGTGANTNVFTITPSTNTANAGTFSLTFRASDGVNIASAAASFTLQFKVQNQNYTTALITSVGADNAVNNSFDDKSTNDHAITAAGNATQTTFSPYRHGGYSTYFDGSGDYLTVANDASLQMGTGDFTFEWWWNPDHYATMRPVSLLGTGAGSWSIVMYSGGTFDFVFGTSAVFTSAIDYEINQWAHIAIVRQSGTVTCYVNGVSQRTASNSYNVNATTGMGIGYDSAATSQVFKGSLVDVRIIKGTAVYTAAFTPPTERLTAITNTSLLTCHLPYIADGSTNDHAITVTGNTSTRPFVPYDAQEYSASSHGGSMYFDGTGDYLSIADHADLDMGSSDFTIEGWYYPVVTPGGSNGLLSKRANSSEANGILIYFGGTSTGEPSLLVAQSGSWSINTASSITFKTGQWNHFAIVRNGTSFKLYINGKAGVSVTSSITVTDNGHPFIIGTMGADGSNPLAESNISDFRVVKGTAVYTAEFTPPTEPLTAITNTKLLVQSTDAGIIDKAQSVKAVTLNGNVSSSTTQTKYLSSSMAFDGTGDYITMTPSDLFAFGTGDFTIEGWAYITATGDRGLFQQGTSNFPATNSNSVALQITNASPANSEWAIYAANGYHESTVNYSLNQWYHFAVVRASAVTKLYIDGTEALSVSDSVNYTGTYFGVGSIYGAATAQCFTGYMSDFRVTKGLARYTSNFTPPAAALQG